MYATELPEQGEIPHFTAVRGLLGKDVYGFDISAASCGRSCLYASYESHVCPLSYGI